MASLLQDIETLCVPEFFHAHDNCLTQQIAKHYGADGEDTEGWVSSYECRKVMTERGYSSVELQVATDLYNATGRISFRPTRGVEGHAAAVELAEEILASVLVPA